MTREERERLAQAMQRLVRREDEERAREWMAMNENRPENATSPPAGYTATLDEGRDISGHVRGVRVEFVSSPLLPEGLTREALLAPMPPPSEGRVAAPPPNERVVGRVWLTPEQRAALFGREGEPRRTGAVWREDDEPVPPSAWPPPRPGPVADMTLVRDLCRLWRTGEVPERLHGQSRQGLAMMVAETVAALVEDHERMARALGHYRHEAEGWRENAAHARRAVAVAEAALAELRAAPPPPSDAPRAIRLADDDEGVPCL